LLDINIVGRIPPLKRIKYLPVMEKGEHLELPFIQYRNADSVIIQAKEKLHAHIDGEYIYEERFDIRILPGRFSFLY
jgi:diacylglycerol kinase (ATP)